MGSYSFTCLGGVRVRVCAPRTRARVVDVSEEVDCCCTEGDDEDVGVVSVGSGVYVYRLVISAAGEEENVWPEECVSASCVEVVCVYVPDMEVSCVGGVGVA